MNSDALHEKLLYPICRVRSQKAGGSGVLVYSREDPQKKGRYINIALTCQHVVDDSIRVKEDWDPVLRKDVKRDFFEEVQVELFDYDGSRVISANSTPAEIIAYDKHHDLAAVRLLNHRPQPYVATTVAEADIPGLRLFDPCWTSGCSLLHEPFANQGTLTYLREIIEQKSYLMYNAPSIFGNSGGGVFHGESLTLLGLSSRITAIQLGFGVDVMTWMGFCTHPERIYEFFRHQELQFLFDEKDDYYAAMERREKRRKAALREMLLGEDKE